MTDAKTNEEPSIEEILGSIRRIIADDEDEQTEAASTAAQSAASTIPTGGDVGSLDEDDDEPPLELTQKIDEDGTVIDLDADSEPVVPHHTPIDPPIAPSASDNENAMVDFDTDETATAAPAETLVSNVAANATAAVMAKLARNTAVTRSAADGGMTIEDMVKDMLRPMLRDWLDDNLPALVQSMVERELERISRRVG